jgi:hypothetical protein
LLMWLFRRRGRRRERVLSRAGCGFHPAEFKLIYFETIFNARLNFLPNYGSNEWTKNCSDPGINGAVTPHKLSLGRRQPDRTLPVSVDSEQGIGKLLMWLFRRRGRRRERVLSRAGCGFHPAEFKLIYFETIFNARVNFLPNYGSNDWIKNCSDPGINGAVTPHKLSLGRRQPDRALRLCDWPSPDPFFVLSHRSRASQRNSIRRHKNPYAIIEL